MFHYLNRFLIFVYKIKYIRFVFLKSAVIIVPLHFCYVSIGAFYFLFLHNYVIDERLSKIPKILETPYINDKPPYKKEIEMLRSNLFDPNYRDNF